MIRRVLGLDQQLPPQTASKESSGSGAYQCDWQRLYHLGQLPVPGGFISKILYVLIEMERPMVNTLVTAFAVNCAMTVLAILLAFFLRQMLQRQNNQIDLKEHVGGSREVLPGERVGKGFRYLY
jgi:hypothetical protein